MDSEDESDEYLNVEEDGSETDGDTSFDEETGSDYDSAEDLSDPGVLRQVEHPYSLLIPTGP